ncbi:MAG: GNAT family N-acetyltransferase [Deltaproteobacteria bacterium]
MPEKMDSHKPTVMPLGVKDAVSLFEFYNHLSEASLRNFRPLGTKTTLDVCQRIVTESNQENPSRIDLAAYLDGTIIGWTFIAPLAPEHLDLGICVTDSQQNRGLGTQLITQILDLAKGKNLSPINLMVVQENHRVINWYKRKGFTINGEEFDLIDQLSYLRMVK